MVLLKEQLLFSLSRKALFPNTRRRVEAVSIFNKTNLSILSNFIPNKLILCEEKDPLWLKTKMKWLYIEKLKHTKSSVKTLESQSANRESEVSSKSNRRIKM